MTKWHDDARARKAIGDTLERQFETTVKCSCGGHFDFIGDVQPGFPDYTCSNCGQLVDVKGSPQAEQTGNIAVSATPWEHYPDDMLLVTRIKGAWIGEFKHSIRVKNTRPFDPTHHTSGSKFKNTRFYLIGWRSFRPIRDLGLVEIAPLTDIST